MYIVDMFLSSLLAGAVVVNATSFELGTGPIVGSDAVCNGSESRIVDCGFDRNNNCTHMNDLAVRCQAIATGKFHISYLYTCVTSK